MSWLVLVTSDKAPVEYRGDTRQVCLADTVKCDLSCEGFMATTNRRVLSRRKNDLIDVVLSDYMLDGRRLEELGEVHVGAVAHLPLRPSGEGTCYWGDVPRELMAILAHLDYHSGRYFWDERDLQDIREAWPQPYKGRVRAVAGAGFLSCHGGILLTSNTPRYFSPSDCELSIRRLSLVIEYLALGCQQEVARRVGEVLTVDRHRLGLSQSSLAVTMSRSRITLSTWETGLAPPSPGPLLAWLRALGVVSAPRGATSSIIDLSPQLLAMLRADPERLRGLSPEQFESLIADRLDNMGFAITLTGNTNRKDGGIDIIATPRVWTPAPYLLAVQVKHHVGDQSVSRPDVDKLLSWKGRHFHLAMLVTNTRFTEDARWVAAQEENRQFLRLRGFDDLRRWLEDNFVSDLDWREIPRQIVLAPGVTVEVPRPSLI